MLSDRQITNLIEKHRIFGHFTASGVIRAVREVSKIETEYFIKFIQQRKPKPNETFEDLWIEYCSNVPDASGIFR